VQTTRRTAATGWLGRNGREAFSRTRRGNPQHQLVPENDGGREEARKSSQKKAAPAHNQISNKMTVSVMKLAEQADEMTSPPPVWAWNGAGRLGRRDLRRRPNYEQEMRCQLRMTEENQLSTKFDHGDGNQVKRIKIKSR
jgi:hypothetical protein